MTAYNGLHNKESMIGKSFNKWLVLSYSHQHKKSGNWYYNCRCECGNEFVVKGSSLRTEQSKQCKICSSKINGRKGLYNSQKKHLYFIKCGDYVKIGVSNDVQRRLKDLQSSNPFNIELLYLGENEGCDEEMWHNIYNHRHHRGEWFKF